MALTISGWALGDVVLGARRGSTQLACRLDEAHFQVDSLISEGVHYAALTSVGSHYDDINFEAVGRSESDVLNISSATARSAEILVSKMLAASIRLQYQSSSA